MKSIRKQKILGRSRRLCYRCRRGNEKERNLSSWLCGYIRSREAHCTRKMQRESDDVRNALFSRLFFALLYYSTCCVSRRVSTPVYIIYKVEETRALLILASFPAGARRKPVTWPLVGARLQAAILTGVYKSRARYK